MAESRGKYIIVGIFALALLAAVSAWWYRYTQTRQAAQFWGGAAAETILRAGTIELLTLQPAAAHTSATSNPAVETLTDDGGAWQVTHVTDITQIRGLLNARNALVSDGSLNFTAPPLAAPHWQYALRFRGDTDNVTVLLNLKDARAKALGRPGAVGIERIAEGLGILFAEAAQPAVPTTRP